MNKNMKERSITIDKYGWLSSSKSIFRISNNYCQKCSRKIDPMIVVCDVLWSKIRKKTGYDLLCKDCMEDAMDRKIELNDLKFLDEECKVMLPCNFSICRRLDASNKRKLRYLTLSEFKDKYKASKDCWKKMQNLYLIDYLRLPPYEPLTLEYNK